MHECLQEQTTTNNYILYENRKRFIMSGWPDSNRRPPAPHAGAIPGYATSRVDA